MVRALIAVAFGLFILSIGAGPSVADDRGYRNPQWHREWDRRSQHFRPYAAPPRFHRNDWDRRDRGRWHHGFHAGRTGWWWVIGSSWYFHPAPVYAYPPRMAVVPVPVPVRPQVTVAPYCREYRGDAVIDGTNQRFYGTACLMPDGAWHIVP